MATDLKTYDPARVQVFVGGFTIAGFAPGAMVELAPDQPSFEDDYGVDGEPIRWANRNPFDTLTLALAQSSSSNVILSNLYNADLLTHASIYPVMILDDNTGGVKTTYVAARGWIAGPPRIVFAGGIPTERRWVLRLLNTLYHTQGINGTSAVSL